MKHAAPPSAILCAALFSPTSLKLRAARPVLVNRLGARAVPTTRSFAEHFPIAEPRPSTARSSGEKPSPPAALSVMRRAGTRRDGDRASLHGA